MAWPWEVEPMNEVRKQDWSLVSTKSRKTGEGMGKEICMDMCYGFYSSPLICHGLGKAQPAGRLVMEFRVSC